MAGKDKTNLTDSLSELEKIANWFESQEEVDVEEGLTKVKAAAKLIKDSKARLAEIENEFQEIEKEIASEEVAEEITIDVPLDDVPF
jgi:exonuclease VII small subunit